MIKDHVLYPLSYPRVGEDDRNRTCTSGSSPALSMSYILNLRSAERETAERPAPAGLKTRTQGVPKERGRIEIKQGGKMAKFHRCAT
jgi:hypothetical protein